MEKTLIIIGNGFDLDLGWKTSYSDFYKAKKEKFAEFDRMKYIHDMIQGEHWHNLEGYMRNCIVKMPQERIMEMNNFWLICHSLMFDYLKNTKGIFQTNKNSCAYKFLISITDKSNIISFNYTNPFSLTSIAPKKIEFVHGDLGNTIDGSKLKLGVDSSVFSDNPISKNDSILPIVKTYGNEYIDNVLHSLRVSPRVIFYGHSFGKSDADYFKTYFEHVQSGTISGQKIFLITKDNDSLQQIKDNLKSYEITYNNILYSKCNIIPVFTTNGINDKGFEQILSLI